MSLCELLKNSPRNTNMLVLVPLIRLDLAKNNFIFQASISLIKNKIKNVLLYTQKIYPLKTLIGHSRSIEWYPTIFSRLITLPSA